MAENQLILLDRNENRYGPAPSCFEVLRRANAELLFDYSRDFQSGSYSELSRRLAERHGVRERRIILGYGCEDILKQSLQCLSRPGGGILVPNVSWWYYRTLIHGAAGMVVEYPLVEGEREFSFDLSALLKLRYQPGLQMLLIASPNNPTGNAMPRAELRAILEHYRGVPVVLDQAYFGFTEGEVDDFASLTDEFPDLLVLRSFSKIYGLAGVRVGYAIAGERLEQLTRFCARSLGYNRLSEALALAALDSPEYYRNLRLQMARDRERFYAQLRALDGVRAYQSEANFVLVRLPRRILATADTELRRRGFAIRFFQESGLTESVRITLGTPAENTSLLATLQEVLSGLPGRVAAN